MKKIGGAFYDQDHGVEFDVTLSGRSSLRWILKSIVGLYEVIFVPDYVCQVVVEVIKEFDIELRFYNVSTTFDYEVPSAYPKSIVYVVNYFSSYNLSLQKIIKNPDYDVIFDDVFGITCPKIKCRNWYYFNSFRKISETQASLVMSNQRLIDVQRKSSFNYSQKILNAQKSKHDFMAYGIGEEGEYISEFQQAEALLDGYNDVYSSNSALHHIF